MNGYFEGWYYKHQSPDGSVALIPAFHREENGREYATLQVITDSLSRAVQFDTFSFSRRRDLFRLGAHTSFSHKGAHIYVHTPQLRLDGWLRYRNLNPLPHDIMGPFRFVPFMQCRHSIFSLSHRVDGFLRINERMYRFDNAAGYMEGDRGHSFPKQYLWTQANWDRNSIMLSAADIPLANKHFTGCIGAILAHGKTYRFATYTGAHVEYADKRTLVLRQGDVRIQVESLGDGNGQPLGAPEQGRMSRTIHENLSCPVHYQIWRGRERLMDVVSREASFESAWN